MMGYEYHNRKYAQMNTSKYIFLIILFIIPAFALAQQKTKSNRGGVYVVSTGDTTQVVNPVRIGTRNPEAQFLNRGKSPIADSIYDGINSSYNSLEASTLELYKLLEDVERNQPAETTGNTALKYHISVERTKEMRAEKLAKAKADSIMYAKKRSSADELTANYLKFGDKPTYYINNVEVDGELVNQLLPKDILERNVKIKDTASGNPNGEIWFKIKDKAAYDLGLPLYSGRIGTDEEFQVLDYRNAGRSEKKKEDARKNFRSPTVKSQPESRQVETVTTAQPKQSTQTKKSAEPRKNADLRKPVKQQPVEKWNTQEPVKKDAEPVRKVSSVVEQKKDTTATQPPASRSPRTRVRARTVNNEKVEVVDEFQPAAE